MLGEGRDFASTAELIDKYFSLDTIAAIEQRVLQHPTRIGKFPGPRNEKGYRSDSFERRGQFNIAFLGCSWVEGSGVEYQDIFPVRVKKKLEDETGLKIANWNLGLAAMGMDYLVRIAPTVVNVLNPDLVVIIGTWADRMEHFSGDGKRIALYDPVPILVRMGRLQVEPRDRALAMAFDDLSSEYQDLHSHIIAFNALRGIFDAAKVPWVYSYIDKPKAMEPVAKMQAAGLLPEANFLGRRFEKLDDANPTNKHPGVRSHEAFADVIVNWIKQADLLGAEVDKPRWPLGHWLGKRLLDWRPRKKRETRKGDDGNDIYPLW